MERNLSSYRDPEGYIAHHDGEIFRCILNNDAPVLQQKYEAFFRKAVDRNLLMPFEKPDEKDENGAALLQLEKLAFVSYPYEWGFEQLKSAALLTLDICLLALDHGLTLKDATAFNVQQHDGKMIFIDHTSFELSSNTLPWRPYSQFCRHFMVPLFIASYRGRHINKQFRTNLDGLDIEEACIALPFRARFRPSVFFHIYLHNFLIKQNLRKNKSDNEEARPVNRQDKGKPGSQKIYIEHLKKLIGNIKPPGHHTEWSDYYNNTNYDGDSFREKEEMVAAATAGKKMGCIWDVGANNGHFSRILSNHADMIVSMDIDHAAIDANFLCNLQEGQKNIYPLVMDLANPSPSLGFANAERPTLQERSKPDMVVALALIHHLAVTHNIPFSMQARYFYDLHAMLMIEYVGREDSQFKKILRHKNDDYPLYTQENFEKAFSEFFEIAEKKNMKNEHRCMYFMKPKKKGR